MKKLSLLSVGLAVFVLTLSSCPNSTSGGSTSLPTVVGHEVARLAVLSSIPREAIVNAKTSLASFTGIRATEARLRTLCRV